MNNKIKLNDLIIFIILLLQEKCMYLIPFEWFYKINSNQQQILMVLIIIEFFIFQRKVIVNKNSFSLGIILFIFYYLIELLISSLFNQGIVASFVSSNFYLVILFYFPLMNYLRLNENKKIYNEIICISVLAMLVYFIQFILSFRQTYFLHIDFSRSRFSNLRIQEFSEMLISYGIIISFVLYFITKNKKYGLIFILGFLGNLFIAKGRFTIIALIASEVVILLIMYKNKIKQILKLLFIIIILTVILSQTSIGKMYINSFSDPDTDTASIRLKEFKYYNDLTLSSFKNIVLGMGFIRDNGDELSNILRGPTHHYSRTDIGILGLINEIGSIGMIWYILIIIKCIKKTKYIYDFNKNYSCYIIIGMLVYNIMCIPTMITMNPYRITCFTIMLSLIDFEFLKLKNNNF